MWTILSNALREVSFEREVDEGKGQGKCETCTLPVENYHEVRIGRT